MTTTKKFSEMTPAEKYSNFINQVDDDSHIDKMPTEENCRIAREEDAKMKSEDFSFFLK